MSLQTDIEQLFEQDIATLDRSFAFKAFNEFKFFLNHGEIRAAEKVMRAL